MTTSHAYNDDRLSCVCQLAYHIELCASPLKRCAIVAFLFVAVANASDVDQYITCVHGSLEVEPAVCSRIALTSGLAASIVD